MNIILDVSADLAEMSDHAADWFCGQFAVAQETYAVALSGGDTPRPFYALLAKQPYRDRLPWGRIHWFFGDERFVPLDNPRSNFRMVDNALFQRAPIPPGNIHPIDPHAGSADAAAQIYASMLKKFYGEALLDLRRPLFDVNILGLGPDGHFASLFPHHPALDEKDAWAVGVLTPTQPEPRVTLTLPVLDSSRAVAFLIAGDEKREAFIRMRRDDADVPATHLHPPGAIHVFADHAVAGFAPQ